MKRLNMAGLPLQIRELITMRFSRENPCHRQLTGQTAHGLPANAKTVRHQTDLTALASRE
jgi:hypothetical protein